MASSPCPDEVPPFDDAVTVVLSNRRLMHGPLSHGLPKGMAFEIHQADACLSRSLFSMIRVIELSIRNSVDLCLRTRLQTSDWLLAPPPGLAWKETERQIIEKAEKKLRPTVDRGRLRDGGHDRLVSRLSFGFWAHLFKEAYVDGLWHPALKTLFPDRRVRCRDVFDRLQAIRELRNRIAHHDAVRVDRATRALEHGRWLAAHLRPDPGDPRSSRIFQGLCEPHFSDVAQRISAFEAILHRS